MPLFSLLVGIAQLRKQAVERFIKEFRSYRGRAERGEIELPYQFQYMHRHFTIAEAASTLADVKLVEREETLSLILWDRLHWTKKHPERYTSKTRRAADLQLGASHS